MDSLRERETTRLRTDCQIRHDRDVSFHGVDDVDVFNRLRITYGGTFFSKHGAMVEESET
ncbi:hypothetical protein Sjap_009955 [Stephania japonica]|uniref:Uncharacterized protein n=1 Tax=Stephania japonica TaxID=461633 RepID=A0AAP0JAT7_9MAGN